MSEGDLRGLPSLTAPAAPTEQGRPKPESKTCARCASTLAYVPLGSEPSEDGSTIRRGRWSCDRDACRCRTSSGDCRCSPWAVPTKSASKPTRTMGEVDAAYLKGLRGLPEADLRELGRFMATVRREPEQNAARAELQRRHMKREADRIARAAERLADPVQTSTGAALARALLAAYIRKQEA